VTQAALLRRAFESIPLVPATWNEVDPKYVFLPDSHVRALDPNNMLVVGPRGSGKSFWWHALQNADLTSTLVERASVSTSGGFGEGDDATRPNEDVIEALLKDHQPKRVWSTVVLWQAARAANVQLPDLPLWEHRVGWTASHPEETAQFFHATDDALAATKAMHVVLFDALDRTSQDPATRLRLLSGLLQVVLDLRSRKAVRAKVFVRPDMLAPSVFAFPDASKVSASRVSLSWSPIELYALLFVYLGNADDAEAAAAFRESTRFDWVRSTRQWVVPPPLRRSEEAQTAVFVALAGPFMGTNQRRGHTYPWLPNHLADSLGVVSPRSFLAAMRAAADASSDAETALHWKGIQQGVRHASTIRAEEVQEDLESAHGAMAALKDLVVPASVDEVHDRLAAAGMDSPEHTVSVLLAAGMMEKVDGNRINVPDLYRLHYELRRKGGFRSLKP